jgi:hypothetical protein
MRNPQDPTDANRKPQTVQGNLRSLPAALEPLTALPYWVLWQWVLIKNKWTKVPYQPNGRKAKSDNPATWSTYDEVIAVVDRFDGIGFMLSDHGALDLDDCRDPGTGTVAPWAQALIDRSNSYAEITVSGTGLRIIGTSAGEEVHRKWPVENGASLEAYRRTRRYITISGNPLNGATARLSNLDAVIDATVAEMNARGSTNGGGRRSTGTSSSGATEMPAVLVTLLHIPNAGRGVRHGAYATRNELLMAFVGSALRARVSEDAIVSACVDEAHIGHAIFEHCQDNGGRPYAERQVKQIKGKILDKEVDEINKTHALVLAGNKAAIMKLEDKAQFRLLQIGAFQHWFANHRITVGRKTMSVADYWLGHRQRRQYEGIEFAPGGGQRGYYNLWRGFSVEPRPGECSKFLAHLRDNVAQGNTFLYKWVVGWFAQIVQQPTVKPGTALCLRGKQGVGKTKVGQVFGSLFEDHYELVADPRYITGQFNAHMAQLLLLHADEAFWAGEKRAEGKLKDLITGLKHRLEFKGVDPILVQNPHSPVRHRQSGLARPRRLRRAPLRSHRRGRGAQGGPPLLRRH